MDYRYESKNRSSPHFENVQNQVDEVVTIMRENVNKVIQRDEKLGDLDDRAANLEANSNSFAASSVRLRRKYWWENLKMKLIIGGIFITVIVFIIIVLVFEFNGSNNDHVTNTSSIRPTIE
ncbi:vesicle-associated membrane protein 3 [Lepeophtheirus salmonis]|uniref:Vesicle-associated membrane protein 3 n=1 Tax=Lepeophtheirus salmonis TaxID=72036 RepID=D3PHP7_LEPSM|nr:vesicle-associated membrane protein 3-like [Lepeophtheirus salmonis]ADD38083.1 Vesicle-associated membrane protein 3 [Lepeophtheirus salmonis]